MTSLPQVIEYSNSRVLTTTQIADLYGTDTDNINRNYSRNKERYVLSKHYYALDGNAKRNFLNLGQFDAGLKNAKILYLWTEKGALLHAKSLGTDEAWDMYEELVDGYYRMVADAKSPVSRHTLTDKFAKRVMRNMHRVPIGYYSAEVRLFEVMYCVELTLKNLDPDAHIEISVGKWWKEYAFGVLGIPEKECLKYQHILDNGMKTGVWAYPIKYQQQFTRWLLDVYLVKHLPSYEDYRIDKVRDDSRVLDFKKYKELEGGL